MEINVFMVHRHRLLLDALCDIVNSLTPYRVVDSGTSLNCLDHLEEFDLLILDAETFSITWQSNRASLVKRLGKMPVVVLGRNCQPIPHQWGCRVTTIDLDQSVEEVSRILERMAVTGRFVPLKKPFHGGQHSLSKREQEVFRYLSEGYRNKEIARQMRVAPQTVNTYVSRICQKVGVDGREKLILYALKSGAMGGSRNSEIRCVPL
ncbi:MAG: LuxR C-terminal-related transcriptional regulator [Oleiphilaceae bacterium]|nr:LuxR C-terminal-related transcriptional regulator [Oleiphilaceae bacterium]